MNEEKLNGETQDDDSGRTPCYLPPVAQENDPIGVSDGSEGVMSFCCGEGRHAECTGMTEVALLPFLRIQCVCPCHG